MKKLAQVFYTAAVLAVLIYFTVSDVLAAEANVHIRFSTWHPPAGADVQKLWTPMLEEMKKRSNGRITYSMFPGGALGKGPEHYDIVRTGLSDMGYATLTWTPGRFPLTDVLSSPISCPAKWKGAEIGMGMYERILKSEFNDVKVLHINNCVMAHLWTTKQVHTLEELKGLKIRSPGGLQTLSLEALGATPVFMPLGDVYLSMETGVIDGVVTCPALVNAFKIYEVADYCVPISFGCVSEGLFANKKFWESVPDDLKPIIEEVGRNAYKVAGIFDENWYETSMKQFGESVKIYKLPPQEEARWNERFKKVLTDWADKLEKQELAAKETLKIFREELEKHGVNTSVCPY
jgi:TRAP-type C4-dicarboxylate transport system substrate-binding protein